MLGDVYQDARLHCRREDGSRRARRLTAGCTSTIELAGTVAGSIRIPRRRARNRKPKNVAPISWDVVLQERYSCCWRGGVAGKFYACAGLVVVDGARR
jgi:hypothetical protein